MLGIVNLDPSSVQIKLLMSQVDINGKFPSIWNIPNYHRALFLIFLNFQGDGQIAFDEFVECFGVKELTSAPDTSTLRETFRVFDKVCLLVWTM